MVSLLSNEVNKLTSEIGLKLSSSSSLEESELSLKASLKHSLATSRPSSSTPGATSTESRKFKKERTIFRQRGESVVSFAIGGREKERRRSP